MSGMLAHSIFMHEAGTLYNDLIKYLVPWETAPLLHVSSQDLNIRKYNILALVHYQTATGTGNKNEPPERETK